MNKNKIPLLLMLIAGATACIITLLCNYSTLERLVILFCVLLLFYCLGSVLKWTMEYFEKQNEKKYQAEKAAAREEENKSEEVKEPDSSEP